MFTRSNLQNCYALITGASEGLGREFAFQLAALGMNLILVARDQGKLETVAGELRTQYQQKVLVIPADLTIESELASIKIFLQQQSIQLKLLVNNAGSGGWGKFEKVNFQTHSKMIDLNLKAPILLSQLVFDELCKVKESAIINVSSLAAVQPVPYMSVYAATKSGLTQFSLALGHEWKKYGIYVQTLMPGAIETNFDNKSGGFKAPFRKDSVNEIVKLALTELLGKCRPIVYARKSWTQRLFAKILPIGFLIGEVGKVFSPKDS